MKIRLLIASILAIGLIGMGMLAYIPGRVNADHVQYTRLLQYTGEDHEQTTGDHCNLQYVQSPWNTNSIDIDMDDHNDVYLYARCRVWNNNNWTGNPPFSLPQNLWHWNTTLQYDVWFFYNDEDCSGTAESYWVGTLTVYNNASLDGWAKRITPWWLYSDVQEGDTLTIKWELNLNARTQDGTLMDSSFTQATVHISII
jgi:hypothetical protein